MSEENLEEIVETADNPDMESGPPKPKGKSSHPAHPAKIAKKAIEEAKKHKKKMPKDDEDGEYKKEDDEDEDTPYGKKAMKEETDAAKSIEAKPSDASKAAMMATAMTTMAQMSNAECSTWLQKALDLANSKNYASTIPDSAAAQNAQSIAAKGDPKAAVMPNMQGAMKEDIENLFGTENLSEEFKEKTTVLFDAAVNARVAVVSEKLDEQYTLMYEQKIEELSEKVDKYLSFTAKEWLKENQVAIESTLKSEISEEFMLGLRNLFAEHYMEIPDDKVDLVETLTAKVEELEAELNEQLDVNIELAEAIEEYGKEEVFKEISEGLAMTQVEKLRTLSEGVEFDGDTESFKRKLSVIKEKYFSTPVSAPLLNEEVVVENVEKGNVKFTEPQIQKYATAISRTIKK